MAVEIPQNEVSGGTDTITKKTASMRYHERITSSLEYATPVLDVLAVDKSKFQEIKLLNLETFGKTLVLDNQVQSSLRDEACYHESLVHPALYFATKASHGRPLRVFIGGGGEGATAREVLRHGNVEECVMVDLDQKVVDFCRSHLPEWNSTIWGASNFTLGPCMDCRAWLQENVKDVRDRFDVIIMDICDPLDAGPGWELYTKEFYREVKEKFLKMGGVLVMQSSAADPGAPGCLDYDDPFTTIHQTFKTEFDHVVAYAAQIPSFYLPWGFNIGTDSPLPDMDADAVDAFLEANVKGGVSALKHYDGVTHQSMFHLPKGLRTKLQNETRIFTVSNPVFCKR